MNQIKLQFAGREVVLTGGNSEYANEHLHICGWDSVVGVERLWYANIDFDGFLWTCSDQRGPQEALSKVEQKVRAHYQAVGRLLGEQMENQNKEVTRALPQPG